MMSKAGRVHETVERNSDHPEPVLALTRRKLVVTLGSLGVGLALVMVIALNWGSEPIDAAVIYHLLEESIRGGAATTRSPEATILLSIRLPRVMLGAVTGAALSVAGAVLQALLRNPLAEPYVLGISSGAALGALLALIALPTTLLAQPVAAFMGALVTMTLIYAMSRTQVGMSTERLVLAGIITASFLWSAIAALLVIVHNPSLRGITFWLMGDLSSGGRGLLGLVAGAVAVGILVAVVLSRSLNLLMVGEEDAFMLGVDVERVKTLAYILASLLTGVVVAVSGSVGYVGLIVPHMVRLAWGGDNRLVVPAAALVGAMFVVLADTVARTAIAPRELPVGAVTALVGAPVFVYLLRKSP
ncbi:MAG: iron ABC transporter permease [Acidobacteria bacterium]|nr:MAG: iron ABC transporter permease [Acidobacteriota bacterium]